MAVKSEVDLFIAQVKAAYQTGVIDDRATELVLTRALASSITGHPNFRAIAQEMLPQRRPFYLI